MTVAIYVKIMMLCEIADDVAPTISGISALYETMHCIGYDPLDLNIVLSLFARGIYLDGKNPDTAEVLASSSHSVCVHRTGLYDPTEDVPRIAGFGVIRGHIVHENKIYTELFDLGRFDDDEFWAESYRYDPKDTHKAVDMLLRQRALNHKLEIGFKVYDESLGTKTHGHLIRLGEMIHDIERNLHFQHSNLCKGSYRFATAYVTSENPTQSVLRDSDAMLWLNFEENSVVSSLPKFSRDGKRLYAFVGFGPLIREENGSIGVKVANCFFGSYLDIHLFQQYGSTWDQYQISSICTANHGCIACYLVGMNVDSSKFLAQRIGMCDNTDNLSNDRRSNISESPNTLRIQGLEGGEKQIRWSAEIKPASKSRYSWVKPACD
ncbi:MAG: hypothetical protein LQ342_001853 [Letrouitia transgressa]|nr:MAG: hypothetical protein LQ342_001853 [Letrouitia transgressa]